MFINYQLGILIVIGGNRCEIEVEMKILFKNVNTLLYDSNYYISVKDVLIKDNIIEKIGCVEEDVDRIIDGENKLLIPGLINLHTHIYMTIFRNIADDLPFSEWLFEKILPLEDHLTEEDSYYASLLGIMEMLSTGTTCFNDMYVFTNATSKAVYESGIRAVLGRGLVGEQKYNGADRRINEVLQEMKLWEGKSPLMTFAWAPHAAYTCSQEYLRSISEFSKDKIIHTHMSESENENKDIINKYGIRPSKYYEDAGILTDRTILAHCVDLNAEDIERIKYAGSSIVSCPVSNLKLGNGIANIPKLMSEGINICLGTDGPASNNTLNMFKEIQFMSLIHKGVHKCADIVTASDTIKFATQNGAKALGFNKIGLIEEGYSADLVLLNLDEPGNQPTNNLVSALAYTMNGSQVHLTMVSGKILYDDGQFCTIDSEKVYKEIKRIIEKYKEII